MKMIWGAAMAAMVLAASPVAAQDTTEKERNQTLNLYYTSMLCVQSASLVSVFDPKLDDAGKKALEAEGAYWLVLADILGKKVGHDANKEFVDESQRILAAMDLIGNDAVIDHYTKMRPSCNSIYVELQKSK